MPPRRSGEYEGMPLRRSGEYSVEMAGSSRRTRSFVFTLVAVTTGLGIFSSLLAYNHTKLFTDRPQPFSILFALNLSYWYGWGVLLPGIFWMARRYRFGRHTWGRAALMHMLAVPLFTAAHVALAVSARVVIMKMLAAREVDWWMYFTDQFFLYFDWNMMTYWAIVGLSHAIDFHREAQERALTEAELNTRLAEARLKALQQQLHPHFLFNTLHTNSALMHRDRHAADDMLIKLGDLLRLSLDRTDRQHVSLKDEIDFLQKYLEIEQKRFGDRLRVHMDIDPTTLDAAVPNLLLQPLVENAVKHGVAPRIGGGQIEVIAARTGGDLRMIVRDNGAGMSLQALDAFNTGVGLSNTRARLEHLYGPRHSFSFETPAGGGFEVTISVPFTQERESPGETLMERLA
jgi:two-component system LytT family sensor kinase